MSYFVYSPPPTFSLDAGFRAPMFLFISSQAMVIQIAFLPDFWRMPVVFLVVQSIHAH